MTKSDKSLRNQLKTVGRLPKFLALLGVSSLILPVFSYAATAATVKPSAQLAVRLQGLSAMRFAGTLASARVPVTTLVSKMGTNGALHTSTHYSALLGSRQHHYGSTATTVRATTTIPVAPSTSTTVVASPNTTTTTVRATTTIPVAPTTTTTVAPTTTTTVAPTTTTVRRTTTTVAPTTTTVSSGSPQPVGPAAGPWNLTFDSEFNGTALDTTQWSTGWFGSGITNGVNGLNQACMDPAQVSVTDGALNLSAIAKSETCAGVTQPYTSGMVTTNGLYNFTYGLMEARVWLPGSGGVADWPAFWTIGPTWPASGEIDVMEGMGGLVSAHLHEGNWATGPLTMGGNFTGGWHTFACDWEPGSATFYYDGTNIGTFTSGVPTAAQYLILDLALSSTITAPNTAPATMKIDYVRVWQH